MAIRTIIVDDEELARNRIRTLLKSELDIAVVGECGDGNSAISAIQRQQPDLLEAYALDYLLKPFNRARFQKALQRARVQVGREQRDDVDRRVAELLKQTRNTSPYLERLVIRSAGRIVFVRVDDVVWFEACANYVRLHTGKETHLLRETMNALETQLDPGKFVRIHRSTIVRIERVRELRSSLGGESVAVLQDGSRLRMSRGYHHRFDQARRTVG
jgi:two-component system LytT family response regulator